MGLDQSQDQDGAPRDDDFGAPDGAVVRFMSHTGGQAGFLD